MQALPHVALANLFGQTETLGAYAAFSARGLSTHRRLGSIGRPLPGVRLRIVRPGSEAAAEVGEVGEILVLSPHNVEPGWLRTGDLARADADGYLYSAGRLADTINRHGVKFGPIEIDAVLRRHPAVSDVAVTGIPDSESGERVEAAVVLARPSTEAELRDFCSENLARFKVPERITFVADIPYNETGKVNRSALVALLSGRWTRLTPGRRAGGTRVTRRSRGATGAEGAHDQGWRGAGAPVVTLPETDDLRAFIEVVAQGTFTAAAQRLHTSQPALSRRIARLEHQIGGTLFERENRREPLLTTLGEILLPYAQKAAGRPGRLLPGRPGAGTGRDRRVGGRHRGRPRRRLSPPPRPSRPPATSRGAAPTCGRSLRARCRARSSSIRPNWVC